MEDTTSPETAILRYLSQPMTVVQLARRLKTSAERCSYVVSKLETLGSVYCLNTEVRRSRLFWLTATGMGEQRRLRKIAALAPISHDFPDIDWAKYSSVCFEHRSIVVKTLTEPLQPAQIKRRAFFQDPTIRFSANNCRDVVRFLKSQDIVRPVQYKRKKHLRYELTGLGAHLQRLLRQAEAFPS